MQKKFPVCFFSGLLIATAFGFGAGEFSAASAKVTSKTSINYYKVSGSNAANLHQQMIAHGPSVSGSRAYAALRSKPSHDGQLIQTKNRCQLRNYVITVNFEMTLPRLAKGKKLSSRIRSKWRSFERFTKRHEDKHRHIWLGCMRVAEKKVRALRLKSCKSFKDKAFEIVVGHWKRCSRKHDAFDRAERSRLARHPLIVAAAKSKRAASRVLLKVGTSSSAKLKGRLSRAEK